MIYYLPKAITLGVSALTYEFWRNKNIPEQKYYWQEVENVDAIVM